MGKHQLPHQSRPWVLLQLTPLLLDLLLNVILTILGFLPGTIHAFYVLFVYYDRRDQARQGLPPPERAPGIFSHRVQRAGHQGYGTMH